jgi:hypothetical protein
MKQTLNAYAQQHIKNNPKHRIIIGLNFVECVDCKEHAHYYAAGYMIKHNSNYSINEKVEIKL